MQQKNTNALPIYIGGEIFSKIRAEHRYYIDKTQFIEELLRPDQSFVSLITRPRRFGKTLMMTTLHDFFDIRSDNKKLFEGLSIYKNKDLCQKWMNKYPTIFVTFKDVKRRSFELFCGEISNLIQNICKEHSYLQDSKNIDKDDQEIFLRLKKGSTSEIELSTSLHVICRAIAQHYQKQVILLIDEYDTPLNNAWQNGYYHEMVDFMRSFLGKALKTNFSLQFALLTGCLRIAKESIFTGLNNFECFGISDEEFSDKIGFTNFDVEKLLQAAGLSEKKEILKAWYDGYCFGKQTHIYCPWDILMCVKKMQNNPEAQPQSYWKNTSGNELVRTLINRAKQDSKEKIGELISGQAITESLSEELTYELIEKDDRALWSMLYLTGYLTKSPQQIAQDATTLVIPNKEVKIIFKDTVAQWFLETLDQECLTRFTQSLWQAEGKTLQTILNTILSNTISYFDNDENYYHGFLTGLLRGAGLFVTSNREHGLGRPDLIIENSSQKKVAIIEIKHTKKYEQLESAAKTALQQIENKKYGIEFMQDIITIVKYGIAFWKKESCVQVSQDKIEK